jgi:hypothetical protein
MKPSVPPNAPVALPPLVAAYVEDPLVDDQLRDYWRKPAIRQWVKPDIIGERQTMTVRILVRFSGSLQGSAAGGDLSVAVDSPGFNANLNLTTHGNRQSVSIVSQGDIRNVSISIVRS